MPPVPCTRWAGSLLALGVLTGQQAPPAPPTLAQVRQAAAHPPARFAYPDGTPFVTLTRPHPALTCLVGDDELTIFDGRRTTALTLSPSHGSYRDLQVSLTGRKVGTYQADFDETGESVAGFQLVLGGASTTALGARGGTPTSPPSTTPSPSAASCSGCWRARARPRPPSHRSPTRAACCSGPAMRRRPGAC